MNPAYGRIALVVLACVLSLRTVLVVDLVAF
jgi:hypothetical protein